MANRAQVCVIVGFEVLVSLQFDQLVIVLERWNVVLIPDWAENWICDEVRVRVGDHEVCHNVVLVIQCWYINRVGRVAWVTKCNRDGKLFAGGGEVVDADQVDDCVSAWLDILVIVLIKCPCGLSAAVELGAGNIGVGWLNSVALGRLLAPIGADIVLIVGESERGTCVVIRE